MNSKSSKQCIDNLGTADRARPATEPARFRASAEAEVMHGAQGYLDTLAAVHRHFQPDVYLEIGIRHGASLALAIHSRVAVGVDPAPDLRVALAENVRVMSMTSDQFFDDNPIAVLDKAIDLAFIDGMHLFEFALRDFMNVERHATAQSVIVFDDIFPNHPLQAERERQSGAWTGDVWKIMPCLRKYRPDLLLLPLDAYPAGLLLVANLDPGNHVLRTNYSAIVDELTSARAPSVGVETLSRANALAPDDPQIFAIIDRCKAQRASHSSQA